MRLFTADCRYLLKVFQSRETTAMDEWDDDLFRLIQKPLAPSGNQYPINSDQLAQCLAISLQPSVFDYIQQLNKHSSRQTPLCFIARLPWNVSSAQQDSHSANCLTTCVTWCLETDWRNNASVTEWEAVNYSKVRTEYTWISTRHWVEAL